MDGCEDQQVGKELKERLYKSYCIIYPAMPLCSPEFFKKCKATFFNLILYLRYNLLICEVVFCPWTNWMGGWRTLIPAYRSCLRLKTSSTWMLSDRARVRHGIYAKKQLNRRETNKLLHCYSPPCQQPCSLSLYIYNLYYYIIRGHQQRPRYAI
jgi:hypothetical protein